MLVKPSPFDLERLQREVNILLISDLHYDLTKEKSKPEWIKGPEVNNRLVKSLLDGPKDWQPDILIVAGDLVNQNRSANYRHYRDLIKKLTRRFPNLQHAYFSTPGNHDINRENMVSAFPYLYDLLQNEPGFKTDDSFTSNPVVDTIYTITKESVIDKSSLLNSLGAFEKEYFKTYLAEKNNLQKSNIIRKIPVTQVFKEIETVYYTSILGITLSSLNSSFFCNLSLSGQDRNNLFLVRSLIDELNTRLAYINGPVVTFMHHPYYYLHESEHIAPASRSKSPDKQNNFTKLVKVSDLILSGHVHGDLQDPTYLQHHAYMITNGTSYTTDNFEGKCYPYTYALIKINKQLGKFNIKKFKYAKQTGGPSDSFAYRCENLNTAKFYKFCEREGIDTTSLETEKVRVLRHLVICYPEYAEIENNWSLYIFQLRLFDKTLEKKNIKYTLKREIRSKPPRRLYKLSYHDHRDRMIWIYRLDNQEYLREIESFLSQENPSFPEQCKVYFSINMDQLHESGVPSKTKIEYARKTYQELVLARKIENVSIMLLYH